MSVQCFYTFEKCQEHAEFQFSFEHNALMFKLTWNHLASCWMRIVFYLSSVDLSWNSNMEINSAHFSRCSLFCTLEKSHECRVLISQSSSSSSSPGGGSRWIFRRYARLGNKFATLCTDIFAWKMYPLYWNVQKIPPQNAPIFMKCTENLAQNSTHLYPICGTNFIQRYISFLICTEC